MPYSADVIALAYRRLEERKADRQSQYNQRLQEAYQKVPRLRQLDQQMRSNMAKAACAAFSGDAASAMEQARQENQALRQEHDALVATHFAPGWLNETPVCTRCDGVGYIGSTMCQCLRQLCLEEQRRQIADLTTGAERFSAFRLDYYPEQIDRNYGASPRMIMEKTLDICRRYAAGFGPGAGNLLFVGGTGLGKTFLSACIANEVTEKGYSVAYESASRLFSKLEKNRFSPDEQSQRDVDNFNNCDLLIIDDLGTEMPGTFVNAALYTLINDRLLANKSTIISTNLLAQEIGQRYMPQIASRIQGSYKGLTFVGDDIRLKNR